MLAALDSVKGTMDGSNDLVNCLEMPNVIDKEMREQCNSSVIKYRKKLVKYWLKYHPDASWEGLAGKLLYLNQNQALEKVKRNIFRTKRGINILLRINRRP